jgi:4-hydroxy-tetrahydrodipicolinate synthase
MVRHDQTPTLGAVVTAMVTPFDESGALDLDAAAALARWLVDHGSDGLVVAGTTGEGPVLTDAERADLWRAVSEAVTVPVVAGAGTNDTRHSAELVATAAAAGADAVLVVTPYYNRPSQAGIFDHFKAVAEASPVPVVVYDIPVRTGRKIATETMLRLAHEVPKVVAVKDAAGDPAASARLMARAPAGFELYSGDDAMTLPLLAVGGVGVISVASHWIGPELGQLVAAFAKGDVDGARAVNAGLIESFDFESTEEFPNPLPAKAACRALGLAVGQCRPPMGPAPAALDERARLLLGLLATPAASAQGSPGG